MTKNNVILEMMISDVLLEFANTAKEDITTSDLQGIAMVNAKHIINMIKLERAGL